MTKMKKQIKEFLNLIGSDYKEAETIIKSIVPLYVAALISFFFLKQISVVLVIISILIGGLLNLLVISANKGFMPVLVKSEAEFSELLKKYPDRKICMVSKKTKFSWLSDKYCLLGKWISLGDFVAVTGLVVLIIYKIITII